MISIVLPGNNKYHCEIREIISTICKSNIEHIQEYASIWKDKYINNRENINIMSNKGNLATNSEISINDYIYDINITIYLSI